MRSLRIAILTSGRFHVCDLARELILLGHDVLFYSCLPKSRTRQFGVPDSAARSLLPWVGPAFVMMRRTQGTQLQHLGERALVESIRRVAPRRLEECDAFIGMSGMSFDAAITARDKFGAEIWIERGSRHILSQRRILDQIDTGTRPSAVSDFAVRQELADYRIADRVAVPSRHVARSFLEEGFDAKKLFVNPYGVDLKMFPATPAPPRDPPTLLMVGAWSKRKGCDVLTEAWRLLPHVHLIHVGKVLDLALPVSNRFHHFDAVPQASLTNFYAKAHVFVLASREEGLATVQLQALASGLRLVCTDRTGGEDLKSMLPDPSIVTVVPTDDAAGLAAALEASLSLARCNFGVRDHLGTARENLSWAAYARRYSDELTASFESAA
jgi:starch synthase